MISLKLLTKRERLIFYLTLSTICSSLVFNHIFKPLVNKFNFLNQEILTYKIKLAKAFRLLGESEGVKAKYAQVSSMVKEKVSEEELLASILSELENLAKLSGLRITDIRPQSPKALRTHKEFLIEVRQEGQIQAHLRFIYELENSQQLLRIKKLQLNPKTDGQLEGNLLISKICLPNYKR